MQGKGRGGGGEKTLYRGKVRGTICKTLGIMQCYIGDDSLFWVRNAAITQMIDVIYAQCDNRTSDLKRLVSRILASA